MRKILFCTVLLSLFALPSLRAESWEERAWRQLNKRVTVDLVDSKLSDACKFVSDLTGLTIIIDPKIMKNDPAINLRVTSMDAGTFIKWLTKLTDTYANVKDQAIFISDKPDEEAMESEKTDLLLMAAAMHVEIDLPPKGEPLTDADVVKIALKILDKEAVKPTDFPGPELELGVKGDGLTNSFTQPKP